MSSQSPQNDPLEQVTAPRDARSELDSEQAALRESYLQLGTWLEQAAGEFDEAAFLAKLQRNIAASELPATTVKKSQPWLLALLAVAAALLLAFVGWRWSNVKNEFTKVPPAKLPTVVGVELPWTDPLDDQLLAASQQVREASGSGGYVDQPLQWLQDQMREMEADLQSGSL